MLKSGNDDAIQVEESEKELNSDDGEEVKPVVEVEDFNGRAKFVNEKQQIVASEKKKIDAKTSLSNFINKDAAPTTEQPIIRVQDEKKQLIEGLNIKNIK